MTKSSDKFDFKINSLVFVKVKGFPFWPAKISGIDKENYKNLTKYEVTFFSTNETALVSGTDICHYNEQNKVKYSLESVAKRHKEKYKIALTEIEKAQQKLNKLSPLCEQKTPLNKHKARIMHNKTVVTLSAPVPNKKVSSKIYQTSSVQTDCLNTNIKIPDCNSQTNTDEKLSISLSVLENKWISDDTIQLYYDMLTISFLRCDKTILLMNTVVTHAIKCLKDIDHLLEPLKLCEKTHIFFPIHDLQLNVNENDTEDSQNLYKTEGSHWSLLVFVKSLQKFLYFDSKGTYNYKHAQQIVEKVHKYLKLETVIPLQTVSVPQQPNNVDCGVYSIIFTEILLQLIKCKTLDALGIPNSKLPCTIKQSDIITKRAQLTYLWHNYQHVQLSPQLISDLMFKSFESELSRPHSGCNKSKQNCLTVNSGSNTSKSSNEKWQTVKNSKHKLKNVHPNANEEFEIQTSNKFDSLSGINQGQQIRQNNNVSKKIKTTTKSKRTKNLPFASHPEKVQVKVEFFADSQGRGLPEIVGLCSNGTVYMDGLVKPGADCQHVYSHAARSQHQALILVAGTNDMLKGQANYIYEHLESKLHSISKTRTVCITTIPPRYDKQPNDMVHYDIAVVNNYIRELVLRMKNVDLIDFDLFKRHHFTQHGLHLNYAGKKKLALKIIDFVQSINEKQYVTCKVTNENFLNGQGSLIRDNKHINITEAHMADVIMSYRADKTIGFAHSISADFDDPRHMSAGVAVVFRQLFGRPNSSQLITNHLALQHGGNKASVFSLVTKDRFYGKPTKHDYDVAFHDLTVHFKKNGLKHLICSPIGCVRDKVSLTHFAHNIVKFQLCTKAKVTIVSYHSKPYKASRNIVSHDDFLLRMRELLCGKSTGPATSLSVASAVTLEHDQSQSLTTAVISPGCFEDGVTCESLELSRIPSGDECDMFSASVSDVELSQSKSCKLYRDCVIMMWILYNKCKMVHADLSEYNLLYHDGQVYMIDVSQSVELDHVHALEFLRKDCTNITDFFRRNHVATMTVKELFDFITDPTITDKNMEACLDKLSELADSRGVEPTNEERIDEEVFKSAYIPQTLTEVIDFERDISMVKSAASGKVLDDLHYRTLLGMGQDLKPLKIPTLLADECENSEEDEDVGAEEDEEDLEGEETEDESTKFINSARPRDESPNSKKARKKAVKEQQAEKRKTKVPKHVKKRNEKSKKTK